jgi:hypothetical protein|nr:MAG TPA: hypothetical protein [Caudoviricetes sp.]
MLVRVDNYKIYIVKQDTRSNGFECIQYDIVASMSYPDIRRRSNGTIDRVYIQGDESSGDDFPLITRDNSELRYVISKLKAFCNHFDEPFGIVGGRLKLNDYWN